MKRELAIIEEATTAVLTLAEGLTRQELLGARLTRAEVRRQLLLAASTLRQLDEADRRALPEIDWNGWSLTAERIERGQALQEDALWFAVRALTPATLTWLRVYRSTTP